MNKTLLELQQENISLKEQNELLKNKLEIIWTILNDEEDSLKEQERQAENYVNNIILPKAKQSQEIGTKTFWQGAILNFLKHQALNFIATTLKRLAIENLIDLANWLLEQLEDYLVEVYSRSNKEEKELFLSKIKGNFPHSRLLEKLNHE